jgi:diguanylate cyclase (GGDEF)-like protein
VVCNDDSMSAADGIDVARAGQRLKSKMLVALVLSSVVPTLVLAFGLLVVVLPTLVQILVGLTIIGTLTGAWVLWDVGRIVARRGALMTSEKAISGFERRQDEIDILMTSYNKMLATIEQQAAEINTFATRLDAAYKDLESTNARLYETSFKDDVTGLYNRRFLLLRLEEEVGRWKRRSEPFSLVLFELSGVRAAADTMNYADYEAALDTFARMISDSSRGSVIARYDGSRFAALLVSTPREGALRFVQMVRDTVASRYPNGQELALKVGIAAPPDDGGDTFELMSAADAALRRGQPRE